MQDGNAPVEVIEHYAARAASTETTILTAAQPAFSLFCGCRADYETISHATGVRRFYNGISRTELNSIMSMTRIKKSQRKRLFREVCLIEQGALEAFRAAESKQGDNG